MVVQLLEKMRVGIVLVVDLQKASWQSQLSLVGAVRVVDCLETLSLVDVGEELSVFVGGQGKVPLGKGHSLR